jgi:hypothetical protein
MPHVLWVFIFDRNLVVLTVMDCDFHSVFHQGVVVVAVICCCCCCLPLFVVGDIVYPVVRSLSALY